jgi:hypothetical protein
VFVLVFAVPALLVVVLGYTVGHWSWTWLGGVVDAAFGTSLTEDAEVAGWLTGLVLLAVSVRVCLALWRSRRRS